MYPPSLRRSPDLSTWNLACSAPRRQHAENHIAGKPYPQGATWDGTGVNFSALLRSAPRRSRSASSTTWSPTDCEVIPVRESTGYVWHCYLPGVEAGPAVRLSRPRPVRPGARPPLQPRQAADRSLRQGARRRAELGRAGVRLQARRPAGRPVATTIATTPGACPSPSSPPRFRLGERPPAAHAAARSIIYELHVKGFTARHPEVPEELRGTYAGLAHPTAIDYLKKLGVTAVELMPVHAVRRRQAPARRGLRNYWGYNTRLLRARARYCARRRRAASRSASSRRW